MTKKLRLPALYREAVTFIEKHGGHVTVIGEIGIRRSVGAIYNHELVIRFTGVAPESKEQA